MTGYVTRSQWGAKSPQGSGNSLSSNPKGSAIHWEGPTMGTFPHGECDDRVRSIQNYHMNTQGWSDIAYNLMACPHDYVYECRGRHKGSAANGSSSANYDWYAICALVGEDDPQPPGLITALQFAAEMCRDWGAGTGSCGHRDLYSTACPGDDLYALVKAGTFTTDVAGGTTPPSTPDYGTDAGPGFPLPSGHYFGPAEGPACSHSGYYSDTDASNLATWQTQMVDRGWSLSVDGLYGPETAGVAAQFQAEKGLWQDGLIGAETWSATWNAPVT